MPLKSWKIEVTSTSYYLLVSDEWLGQVSVAPETEAKVIASLEQGAEALDFPKIHFAQITSIDLPEQSAQLSVHTQQGDEFLFPIPALDLRFEVFHYLNEHPSKPDYRLEKATFFQAAKYPLSAGILLSAIFGYLYYLATELEAGAAVDVASLFQPLVSSGSEVISWIYLATIFVLFVLLLRKVTAPKITHRLVYSSKL